MKQKKKITKDILIADLLEAFPELSSVLVQEYGFHCVGCAGASMESLEQGAEVHGMSGKEIEEMIKDLESRVK